MKRIVSSIVCAAIALIATSPASLATPPPSPAPEEADAELPHVLDHLHAPDSIQWFPVASILASREESCIDGRSPNAVVGSPGGDTGDLLLALSAWEAVSRQKLAPEHVSRLLEAYLRSLGTFYLHTDDHALDALRTALRADPRLAAHRDKLVDAAATRDFVVSPALASDPAAEAAVDAALLAPDHIGCGHLRLIRLHPDNYGVRPGLFEALVGAIFRTARRQPGAIDFARLEGHHGERSVLIVRTPDPIHAHTLVPGIVPALLTRPPGAPPTPHEFFVYHPSVAAFMRAENGWFTLEEAARLGYRRVAHKALAKVADDLAERQIRATLAALAAKHPVFQVHIARDTGDYPVIQATRILRPSRDDLTH